MDWDGGMGRMGDRGTRRIFDFRLLIFDLRCRGGLNPSRIGNDQDK
jgi:hypothetical protein